MKPRWFLSDLHLRAPDDARTRAVVGFLRRHGAGAEAVYLVGDVFDFWLGYRTVVYHAFFPVLRALAELVEGGTRVVLFAGNHDPDPGDFFGTQLGVEVHRGALVEQMGPYRVHLEHGDVVDPRGLVRRLTCRAARNPLLLRAARAVHPDLAWRCAGGYAARDHRDKYGEPLPRALLEEYLPRQARAGADVVVLGHYHRAVRHHAEVEGRPVRLFVLGDWVRQRTCLRFDGDFALLRDQGPDTPLAVLPPGDHGPSAAPFLGG